MRVRVGGRVASGWTVVEPLGPEALVGELGAVYCEHFSTHGCSIKESSPVPVPEDER